MVRKGIALGLIVAMILAISPKAAEADVTSIGDAKAKWVDGSDELPGTSGKTILIVAAAGVGLIAAILIWKKTSGDSKPSPSLTPQSRSSRLKSQNEWIAQVKADPRFEHLWQLGQTQPVDSR